MSDPAIAAADKALRGMIDVLGDPGPELGAVMRDLAIAAARAALNPDTGTEVVTVPLPTDTYNSELEMSMWGWEPAEGLPYYVEFIPNAGSGQVELEHEGERDTDEWRLRVQARRSADRSGNTDRWPGVVVPLRKREVGRTPNNEPIYSLERYWETEPRTRKWFGSQTLEVPLNRDGDFRTIPLRNIMDQSVALALGEQRDPLTAAERHRQEVGIILGKIRLRLWEFNSDRAFSSVALPLYEAGSSVLDSACHDLQLAEAFTVLRESDPEDSGYSDVFCAATELVMEYAHRVVEQYRERAVLDEARTSVQESEKKRVQQMMAQSDRDVQEHRLQRMAAVLRSRLG